MSKILTNEEGLTRTLTSKHTLKRKEPIPSTFTLTWKNARENPPEEGGRYWCVVRDINDLGTSHYQWNCAYNPEATWEGKWSSNAMKKDVVLWTELPKFPKYKLNDI